MSSFVGAEVEASVAKFQSCRHRGLDVWRRARRSASETARTRARPAPDPEPRRAYALHLIDGNPGSGSGAGMGRASVSESLVLSSTFFSALTPRAAINRSLTDRFGREGSYTRRLEITFYESVAIVYCAQRILTPSLFLRLESHFWLAEWLHTYYGECQFFYQIESQSDAMSVMAHKRLSHSSDQWQWENCSASFSMWAVFHLPTGWHWWSCALVGLTYIWDVPPSCLGSR